MGVEPQHKVQLFLVRAKTLLGDPQRFFVWSRKENSDTLAQLGLRYQHQIEILLSLTYRGYSETLPPTPDQPEAWVFGTTVEGREIYIKLGLVNAGTENECLACISFHFSERAMVYPYART